MPLALGDICCILLSVALACASTARAEVSEIKVAKQYGISYLPLMLMEDAEADREACQGGRRRRHGDLGEVRRRQRDERRAAVEQSAVRVGRRRSVGHAVVAHARQPRRARRLGDQLDAALSQHAQSRGQDDQGLHRQGQDRAAGGQGLDPGGHAADGGRKGVRRRPAEPARPAHRHDVASRRAGGAAVRVSRRSPRTSARRRSSTSSCATRRSTRCSIRTTCWADRRRSTWCGRRRNSATRTRSSTTPSSRRSTRRRRLINSDQPRAAEAYLRISKDKDSVQDIVAMLNDPQIVFTTTPQNVMKYVDFMFKIGAIKVKPDSWKDLFFPNAQSCREAERDDRARRAISAAIEVDLGDDSRRARAHRAARAAHAGAHQPLAGSRPAGATLFFKCENLQKVAAFKARGACNAVLSLPTMPRPRAAWSRIRRAITARRSRGLRRVAAFRRGSSCRRTPRTVKQNAVQRLRRQRALCEPTLRGARGDCAAACSIETGATLIHPYDDWRVIAGQGTAALELLDDMPDLDAVIAPRRRRRPAVGHGASPRRASGPRSRVYGAEPAGADDAARSLRAGHVIPQTDPRTIADGLRSSLGREDVRGALGERRRHRHRVRRGDRRGDAHDLGKAQGDHRAVGGGAARARCWSARLSVARHARRHHSERRQRRPRPAAWQH